MRKRRSEIRQVRIKKVSEESNRCKRRNCRPMVSKVGSLYCSMISLGDTCLLPRRHPAYSRHELDPGFRIERGNSSRDVKRKPYK